MLEHGYEGVRQIEAHVTNTMGWSATTGDVSPWVYQKLSETFVLDDEMRRRLAELNPVSAARLANRLIEAQEREYWGPMKTASMLLNGQERTSRISSRASQERWQHEFTKTAYSDFAN